ncbi:MAG: acyl-phosphate glycerol 3-phosphate acyltransferase [Deltaproteobacteria bacterium]|nr:MAG: acyl-phosphate glycerol 3-phosphate acyltransferase [Deltaproteobacteria bacterium]RLB94339.1 MAG: acyl-phosphate glycerol 3-phosphate acyltransferase [Deltaproteobacteria bacterium]RLC09746.1 MAG: acyl-phosphate glycerol 3-phosphate acyltransferase [Deltaproteobacteria bacterium]
MNLEIIALLACAYLVGSIPCGVVLTRLFSDVDVTKEGSGNIGAFNVFCVAGKRLGIMTLAGDVLKGALPVLFAVYRLHPPGGKSEILVCLVALLAFLGHLFPIFFHFKGGKGVATAAGCFMVISPYAFVVCALVYVMVLCFSGYSSAGSLSAATILPAATWFATHSVVITGCALIMTALIFVRHADNIKRLRNGTERSAWERRWGK